MAYEGFSPLILPLATTVIGLSSIAYGWRMRRAARVRGRQAVERLLAERGETLVDIAELPVSRLLSNAGLRASIIFQVRARTPKGDEQTYQWAYAPPRDPATSTGLQRCAHGVWIALA
jgi:hypothetical protein